MLKELFGQYTPRDVINVDESDLFFLLPPNNVTGNDQAQRIEVGKGSHYSRNVLQHNRHREDGLCIHRQVEEIVSISESHHQENEVCLLQQPDSVKIYIDIC